MASMLTVLRRHRWLYYSTILIVSVIIYIDNLDKTRTTIRQLEKNRRYRQGDLFNNHEESFYWFEPLDGVYNSLYGGLGWHSHILNFDEDGERRLLERERNAVTDSLMNLVNCELGRMPVEVLLSRLQSRSRNKAVSKYHTCVGYHPLTFSNHRTYYEITTAIEFCSHSVLKMCHPTRNQRVLDICYDMLHDLDPHTGLTDGERVHFSSLLFRARNECMDRLSKISDDCLGTLQQKCKSSKGRVSKLIRMSLHVAEDIIARDPSVKFIHYVRDPRGIINSRNRTDMLLHKDDMFTEGKLLCVEMFENAKVFQTLSKRFPENFLLIRYEDLATNTTETTQDLLSFANLPMTSGVKRWIKSSTKSIKDGGAFRTRRANSAATARKWKEKLSLDVISYLDENCEDVYSMFGYEKYDILATLKSREVP